MKKVLLMVSIFFVLSATGCDNPSTPKKPELPLIVPSKESPRPIAPPPAKSSNRGFGYIPLNFWGRANEFTSEIFAALQKFEQDNQGIYITSWSLEERNPSPYVYGIWISWAKIE